MKVVVAHNRYRSDVPSGENVVVDAEIAALRAAAVDVVPLLPESDWVSLRSARGLVEAGLGPVYAPRGVPRLRALLERERPDVLHLHNVYPLLSPWSVRVARQLGIPVVVTAHNVRITCVAGTHIRDGEPCYDCLGHGGPLPAVIHGCYRGSRPQSVPMAVGQVVHRRTWRDDVDRWVAPSSSVAAHLVRVGVPEGRVAVLPHTVAGPAAPPPPGDAVLFLGRLDTTKGIDLLLAAWARVPAALRTRLLVAGRGDLGVAVAAAAAADPTIEVLGQLGPEGMVAAWARAGLAVVPSRQESFGLVAVEAFAHGRPVIATRRGGLVDIVDDLTGWLVEPDVGALADALVLALTEDTRERAAQARERYQQRYSASAGAARLVELYRDAVTASRP